MIQATSLRISSFFFGFTLPYRSLRLILKKPTLLAWSLFPLVLTLALSIYGVGWMKAQAMGYGIHWLAGLGLAPESVAVSVAVIFLKIVLFVLAAVSFSFFATIIASPFNDFLSESTENFCRPALPIIPLESRTLRSKLRTFWIDVVKTFAITIIQIGLIFIGLFAIWVPVINLIPFVLTFWLLTFQFVSYPQTRRFETLKTSISFLFRHAFASLGFGASIGFLFAIPFVSAFALPLAVVGGTLLYARGRSTESPLK